MKVSRDVKECYRQRVRSAGAGRSWGKIVYISGHQDSGQLGERVWWSVIAVSDLVLLAVCGFRRFGCDGVDLELRI